MQVEIEFYVYRGDGEAEEEIELTVVGDVEGYVPANLSGHPDNWTPPEGGSSCVEAVLLNGKPWGGKLTDKERKEAEEQLYNAAEDSQAPDSGYDAYRDRLYD